MSVADPVHNNPSLSTRKKLLLSVLVMFLVYSALEIFSAVVLWFGIGWLESPVASMREPTVRTAQGDSMPGHLAVLSLHPYLGYVYDRDANAAFSKHGFTSETLYSKSDGSVVVGIFGGSVADQLFVRRQTLAEELKKIPGLGQKSILFANLAIGGFKQPQQLMALTYLLSLGGHLDIVINIDGFNEVTLPQSENVANHVFPFFPRQWHLLTMNTVDPIQASLIGKMTLLQHVQEKIVTLRATFPLRYSMTARLFAQIVLWSSDVRLSQWRLALQRLRGDEKSLRYAQRGPEYPVLSEAQLFQDLSAMWARGSLQMKRLCDANGIRYFHFLQPNQYLVDTKPMGEEERRVAYREDQPYRAGVISGYPFLREKGKALTTQGVQFFDLTQVFLSHPEPVYGDSCCHFNDHGLEILNRFIGEAIVKEWQPPE